MIPLVACAIAAESAHSQELLAIERRHVDLYAELLEFDDDQRQAAMNLHREYRVESRRIVRDIESHAVAGSVELLADVRDGKLARAYLGSLARSLVGDPELVALIQSLEHAEQRFFDGVLDLAQTPEQRAGVERVERARRRHQAAASQSTWGDSADVVDMVRRLGFSDQDGVAEIMRAYELAIDPVRRSTLDHFEHPVDDAVLTAKRINIEYAQKIFEALPEKHRQTWQEALREAFWPEPYERSGPQKVIMTLRLSTALTDEQRQQLEDIAKRYETQAAPINQRWAAAVDAQLQASAAGSWAAASEARETIYRSREERRTLDERFEDLLGEFLAHR